jgi:uncharacterized protein (UPF0264 family)
MTRLLVSVRSAAEAHSALVGGCDLLDAKEPSAGPLGAVSPAVLADILAVAGDHPVSAALGELPAEGPLPLAPPQLCFIKVGLAHWAGRNWRARLAEVRSPRLVVAAYADHVRAEAPPPEEVLEAAIALRLAAFLLDTAIKDGRTLPEWVSPARLGDLIARAHAAGLPVALAGSLTAERMADLAHLAPDWFAVRGAACDGGRDGVVTVERVRALVTLLHPIAPGTVVETDVGRVESSRPANR